MILLSCKAKCAGALLSLQAAGSLRQRRLKAWANSNALPLNQSKSHQQAAICTVGTWYVAQTHCARMQVGLEQSCMGA